MLYLYIGLCFSFENIFCIFMSFLALPVTELILQKCEQGEYRSLVCSFLSLSFSSPLQNVTKGKKERERSKRLARATSADRSAVCSILNVAITGSAFRRFSSFINFMVWCIFNAVSSTAQRSNRVAKCLQIVNLAVPHTYISLQHSSAEVCFRWMLHTGWRRRRRRCSKIHAFRGWTILIVVDILLMILARMGCCWTLPPSNRIGSGAVDVKYVMESCMQHLVRPFTCFTITFFVFVYILLLLFILWLVVTGKLYVF